MTVSRELNSLISISEETLALLLEANKSDALTDALVESLDDALRILEEEIRGDTFH
ncbi:hypothetical protein LH464_03990 [Neorhizobium sp. T786]|uniref:hypothetical protein n=1 Tax=Pseudorhizobium xiangyangii TaxID=2883104 RepID=UPI001CFF837C|nr:hypothetical protein [Neorhizobium xiangyangii]MCB5201640.1 hypothetical protein [Neorhizobium xiangyangii]